MVMVLEELLETTKNLLEAGIKLNLIHLEDFFLIN